MSASARPCSIVTGASSGIGRAAAIQLAQLGHDVAITYNQNAKGAAAAVDAIERLGRRGLAAHLDLARIETIDDVMKGLATELGGVDVLVNNAGVNRRGDCLDESPEGWQHTLSANLIGPWACARSVARNMIATGTSGRIVNVTSILAFVPLASGSAYCASKAGLESLTKVMALELAEHGIAVNAVAPGHTATPMNFPEDDIGEKPIDRPVIPLGRAASAEEVARTIVFLASGEASYATGASLLVDGGLMLASGPQELQRATGLPPERPDHRP